MKKLTLFRLKSSLLSLLSRIASSFAFVTFMINSTPLSSQCGLVSTLTYSTPSDDIVVPFCTPITLNLKVTRLPFTSITPVDIVFSYDIAGFTILDPRGFQQYPLFPEPNKIFYRLSNQIITDEADFQIVIQCIKLGNGVQNKLGAGVYQPGTINSCTGNQKVIAGSLSAILGSSNTTTTITQIPNNSQMILVRGDVILDVNHTITATNSLGSGFLVMDGNSKLTIKSGRSLSLVGASIFGCTNLYNTVEVQPNASLGITRNGYSDTRPKVKDGIRGITALANSTVSISNCIFEDNQTGFYVPPSPNGIPQNIDAGNFTGCEFLGTGTMKPLVGQGINPVYQYPNAGMELNDMSYVLLTYNYNFPSPRFKDLNNGILAYRTGIFVNQARFENIKNSYGNIGGPSGNGIYIYGTNSWLLTNGDFNVYNPDYKNCSIGITFHNLGIYKFAQINHMAMDNTGDDIGIGVYAVSSVNPEVYIYVMDIKAKIGIRSFWMKPIAGEIYYNGITADYPNDPSSAFGIDLQEQYSSGQWKIYDNGITVQNAASGIRLNSGVGATINDNQVEFASYAPYNSNGIYFGGSRNANVYGNNLFGGSSPAYNYRSGMYAVNTTGSTFRCNSTSSSEMGFNFVGECRPTTLRGNSFRSHNYGLLLNNATFIGTQTNQGNIWEGPFNALGAQHLDPYSNNVNQSRFETVSPNPPIFPTNNFPGWFNAYTVGTDYSCSSGLVSGGSSSSNLYRAANSTEPMKTDYPEEMKWTLQRNAFGTLKDDPNAGKGDAEATNFAKKMLGSTISQLYNIEKGIKDIQEIPQESGAILKNNMAAIKKLVTEVEDLERKITDAKSVDKETYKRQKKEKATTIHQLSLESAKHQGDFDVKKTGKIKALLAENERIDTRLSPETNEKEVNRIFLNTIAEGKIVLSEEEKEIAKKIAFQCPLQGGNAVFVARSIYSLVEEVSYDDLALCNLGKDVVVKGAVSSPSNFGVTPNPATDVITVNRPDARNNDELGDWLIRDLSGKVLMTQKAKNESQSISIQELPEGIYFVSYLLNEQLLFTNKVVKVKSK